MATDAKPGGQSSRGLSDLLGGVLNRGVEYKHRFLSMGKTNKYNFGFPQCLIMFGPSPKKKKSFTVEIKPRILSITLTSFHQMNYIDATIATFCFNDSADLLERYLALFFSVVKEGCNCPIMHLSSTLDRFQRTTVDLTLPWRFANLPNNAKLEIVTSTRKQAAADSQVS